MHPNTHVNKAQSTNDTIPSATHLAVASELDRIIEGVEVPGDVFAAKAEAFRHVVKLGRTCWQDALPHTLGEEFGGYAALSLGSSIMPGKINPTLSEMVIQIAHQVVGNDVAVSMATTRVNLTSTFGMPPSTSASSRACSSSATNSSS